MSGRILLATGLIVFSGMLVQGQSTMPATPAPVNAPFGGPIVTTPTATFPSPAPIVGISDAGRAGASSEPIPATQPGEEMGTSSDMSATTAATGNTATIAPTEKGPANDLGSSVFVSDTADGSTASGPSVVEVSRRLKSEKGAHNARTLSNEDVQAMLSNKGGVTMAKNMPPLGQGALEQSGQPQSAQPAPQNTQSASAIQQGQNAAPATPAASGTRPAAQPEASADNATTPQINQNQQANDAQGSRRLPATATFLPLLGLLGLASGGIGLWFRKFRR